MNEIPSNNSRLTKTCCGIVEGFHRDNLIESILARRPEQRGEWLLPGQPPADGQRVKVQVITEDAWGILTGRITEVGDGFVKATVHRTTDDDSLPSGPYLITLTYDETMECPWVLTRVELANRPTLFFPDSETADS